MIDIRKAKRQDVPRILSLYEDLTEEKINLTAEKIEQVFQQIEGMPNQEFLVAEAEGYIAGTLFLQIVPNLTHNARPWGIIENVVVDGQYRRQGIGSQLIKTAIKSCRDCGCYKVQLLSHKKRREAHLFYRSEGFDDSALGFRMYL
jgi:N-acetylglutamate synthase-like GNAT family acetyltransferase